MRTPIPDAATVRAFLDASHLELATRLETLASETLAAFSPPPDDAAARLQARTLLTLLGEGGWLEPIRAPDLRAIALTREALAAASPLADAVFALQALGAFPILHAGTVAQRERWAEPALRGEAMTGFAMTEPEAGSDVASLLTLARRDGDGWVLDGTKTFISNAGIADHYVVFATTDPSAGRRGISCFIVPADAPGLVFREPLVLSAPHPLGTLDFDSCRIPADHLLGEEGAGMRIGLATLDRLRPTVGAAAFGMAARALEEALAHTTTREQFGRPLADFQLVQDKLARMAIELVAARLLVHRAVWEADRGADRITLEAAMAKAYATEAAQRIIDSAVQLLGGRGVLADSTVDHLYRAIRALRIYEGTTEVQHLVIAGRVLRSWKERATGSAPIPVPTTGAPTAPAPEASTPDRATRP